MFDVFAVSQSTETVIIYVVGVVLATLVLGVGRSIMKLLQSRQTKQREDEQDQKTLAEFFFDTPRDGRTGTPAKAGWTTKVDQTLAILTTGQAETRKLVNEILNEVKEDENGDHNLRGIVKRGAEAAGAEVVRVRKNEDARDPAS